MPHVEIKCFAGRSNDQKEKCAEEIADVIARTLGCKTTSVSVAIKDIPEEEWKTEVWDKDIAPNFETWLLISDNIHGAGVIAYQCSYR